MKFFADIYDCIYLDFLIAKLQIVEFTSIVKKSLITEAKYSSTIYSISLWYISSKANILNFMRQKKNIK